MSAIRKVSTGPDLKNAMHFQIGTEVVGRTCVISDIKRDPKSGDILVYIKNLNDNTVKPWKMINSSVPKHIEFNIEY